MKKFLLLLSIGALISLYSSAQKTYNVTVPAGTNACYIAGNFSAPYLNWGQIEMTKSDATHYTITIDNATGAEGYKYCSGPSWAYVENIGGDRTYSASDVVSSWVAVYVPSAPKIDLVIKAKTTWANTYIYYWGDASNVWPGTLMTNKGDFWEITINQIANVSIIFNNGSGTQTANITNVVANACYNVAADGSYTLADCSTFVVTANPATQKPSVLINGDYSKISIELTGKANASVYTLQGALVKQANFENTHTFDNLSSGMYLLNLNGQTYKALVK